MTKPGKLTTIPSQDTVNDHPLNLLDISRFIPENFDTHDGEDDFGVAKPRTCLWPKRERSPPARPTGRRMDGPIIETMHIIANDYAGNDLCYFIGAKRGPVKIGVSSNVERRMKEMQSGSPEVLQILALVRGGQPRERAYHLQFAHFRMHNEWFVRNGEIIVEIQRLRKIARQVRNEA